MALPKFTWSVQAILHMKLLSSFETVAGIGELYLTKDIVFSSTTSYTTTPRRPDL